MICPSCNGAKRLFAFWDGRDKDGKATSGSGMVNCFTCDGAGEITEEHARRIAAGRARMEARIARRVTLKEEADRLGITPAELSAIESGREPKK
jgi:hypothetical protein